ncbi:MAG: hypothetical protein A3J79_12420 [Elusimicrobia bacterium RIFOXYB2_FULL_62_6]|nr:MAG: hypothetical protein A3J79_12420 [Elusimicrobia bacterium RIFOXYB2_FULL_62_6]
MMDAVIDTLRRVFEKDERSRKFAVQLADSYLRRISRFKDQLVLWGVALNFLTAGYIFAGAENCCGTGRGLAAGLIIFSANLLLGKLYANEHRTTALLFARYPELELIMEGDKSWSNSRMLARVYKYAQAGWMLYSAIALAGLLMEYPLCR